MNPLTAASMSAHTPGPWELDHGDDGDNFTIRADGEFVTRLTKSRYTDDRRDPEAYANAALIAAAPDLLSSLRDVLAEIDGGGDHFDMSAVSRARAAIARAEGR